MASNTPGHLRRQGNVSDQSTSSSSTQFSTFSAEPPSSPSGSCGGLDALNILSEKYRVTSPPMFQLPLDTCRFYTELDEAEYTGDAPFTFEKSLAGIFEFQLS